MQKNETRRFDSTTEDTDSRGTQKTGSPETALEILRSVHDRPNSPDSWLRKRSLEIITSVHDSPKTPDELADELNLAVENVRYHLNKLEEADFVDVKTWYSEEGKEVPIYEPSDSPSLILFGRGDNEAVKVLSSVRMTPKTLEEIVDRVDIPTDRVKRHLKKLERERPPLVEGRKIHRRAVVWSATEAGIDYVSDTTDQG